MQKKVILFLFIQIFIIVFLISNLWAIEIKVANADNFSMLSPLLRINNNEFSINFNYIAEHEDYKAAGSFYDFKEFIRKKIILRWKKFPLMLPIIDSKQGRVKIVEYMREEQLYTEIGKIKIYYIRVPLKYKEVLPCTSFINANKERIIYIIDNYVDEEVTKLMSFLKGGIIYPFADMPLDYIHQRNLVYRLVRREFEGLSSSEIKNKIIEHLVYHELGHKILLLKELHYGSLIETKVGREFTKEEIMKYGHEGLADLYSIQKGTAPLYSLKHLLWESRANDIFVNDFIKKLSDSLDQKLITYKFGKGYAYWLEHSGILDIDQEALQRLTQAIYIDTINQIKSITFLKKSKGCMRNVGIVNNHSSLINQSI